MNILNKKTLTTLAVLAVSASPLANVQAASCDPEGKSGFTLEASAGSTGTISCYATNDTNIHFKDGDVVESESEVDSDSPLFTDVTDLSDSLSGFGDEDEGEGNGTFTVEASVWENWDSIYVGLKQGDGYGLFLLTESILSGTWSTTPGEGNGLSHYLAFGGSLSDDESDDDSDDVSAVPVPAAVWLFGSGLAGLMGAARRKSTAAQA